jgi:hypothetical protein
MVICLIWSCGLIIIRANSAKMVRYPIWSCGLIIRANSELKWAECAVVRDGIIRGEVSSVINYIKIIFLWLHLRRHLAAAKEDVGKKLYSIEL